MRFGICYDIKKIKDAEKAGYDYFDGKLNAIAAYSDEEFAEVLEIVKSSSLKVERCSLLYPKTMAVVGPAYNEEEMVAYLEKAFARMKALGCDLIVFGSGKSRMIPSGVKWQDAFSQLVEVTRKTAEVASRYGVRIAIEHLNRKETNLINTLTEGAALQAMVDRENVGLLADSFHMWQEGEDMAKIPLCAPLMHAHIAVKGTRGYPVEATEEVKEFFAALKAAGYDGTLSVEGKTEDFFGDSAKALEVMRALC